jgi:outer membrane protein assembly factor BamB
LFKKRRFLILTALLLSVFIAGCSRGAEWAGVTGTGENNEFFVSYKKFVAKVGADGKREWMYPESGGSYKFHAEVTLTDDAVYVGDYKGGVHALDRETGEQLWAYEQSGTSLFGVANFGGAADRVIGPLAIGDGVLYVPDEHGIFALDQETGDLIEDWEIETDRAVWSQPIYVPAEGDQPARVFVTSLDQHVYAVAADNAEVLWNIDLDGAIPGTPTFDAENNILFVGTFGSEVVAVDAANGEVLARFETNGWVWESPIQFDDLLYLGDLDGYAYALRFSNNQFEEVWSRRLTEEGKLRSAPVVTDDLVVYGSDTDTIYALQRDSGEEEWSETLQGKPLSTFAQVIDPEEEEPLLVVALADRNEVIALRLANGNERWTYKHED